MKKIWLGIFFFIILDFISYRYFQNRGQSNLILFFNLNCTDILIQTLTGFLSIFAGINLSFSAKYMAVLFSIELSV